MTIPFAFAGRCSTEDRQDPESSRQWQLTRAETLIAEHGVVVAEFFDVGESRSIPWKRRPQAAALLEALRRPDRGFDAVVVGEPQRAFYGNQFGLTIPVFAHYGVPLWVPEIGGPINFESEAHDLVMSVFGGVSKGERTRIKIRVRTSMAAQAKVEGRFLGGRPPYGYTLVDAGPHPNPGKAADGKRLHRLEPDLVAAEVVKRIFTEYLEGIGVFAIAQRLTADGLACPSAHDPARNRHRCGVAWSKSAVRVILTNPRYTGHQVWNRQRKQEMLINVDDVSLGHETVLKWNDKSAWILSDRPVHTALVTRPDFEEVQVRLASRGPKSTGRVLRTQHRYALKGLLTHTHCGRRMQGNWNNGRAHYRCRFPNEYALANNLDHPLTVYVREDSILPRLDAWLAEVYAPERLSQSIQALEGAQQDVDPALAAAHRTIRDCDRKLATHRDAIEAGADPHLVATWSRQTQAERAAAVRALAAAEENEQLNRRLTPAEIRAIAQTADDLLAALSRADPEQKSEVYRHLGLRLNFDHENRTVTANTLPTRSMCAVVVSEGRCAHYSPGWNTCSQGGDATAA